MCDGTLRQSVRVSYQVENSTIEAVYTLDRHARALRTDLKVDWHEIGGETIPVLAYQVPLAFRAADYLYDIPAGALRRGVVNNDVPALRYGLAVNEKGKSVLLASDCKYGYRGTDGVLGLTLINSSTSPDPYPERGIHSITVWTGGVEADEKQASDLADAWNHALFYQPSNAHHGTLPMEDGLFSLASENVVACAASPAKTAPSTCFCMKPQAGRARLCCTLKQRCSRPRRSRSSGRRPTRMFLCGTGRSAASCRPTG